MSEDAKYESGAIRATIKPFYATIPAPSLRRLALRSTGAPRGQTIPDPESGFTLSGGARKYGYEQWRKGMPLHDTFNHVVEHLFLWKDAIEAGDVLDDDNLAGAAWGILLPLMTFERAYAIQAKHRAQLLAKGKTMPEIDDAMRAEFTVYLLRPLSPDPTD